MQGKKIRAQCGFKFSLIALFYEDFKLKHATLEVLSQSFASQAPGEHFQNAQAPSAFDPALGMCVLKVLSIQVLCFLLVGKQQLQETWSHKFRCTGGSSHLYYSFNQWAACQ
jgi:hypothetical protein